MYHISWTLVFLFVRAVTTKIIQNDNYFQEYDADEILNGKAFKMNIRRPQKKASIKRSLLSFSQLSLENQDYFYSADIEVGSPPQKITCVFDTGSSDLWFPSSSNPFCEGSSNNVTRTIDGIVVSPTIDCDLYGTFDDSNSTSLEKTGYNFEIWYSDGSFSMGYWALDTVSISDITLSQQQFAVANLSNVSLGVLGVGFPRLESVSGYDNAPEQYYDNFPQMLKKQGIISEVAYSLYFTNENSGEGCALFGAVDKNKFSEFLYTFPMVNIYPQLDKPATFHVTLQGLGMESQSNCLQQSFLETKVPVLLDSGTTLIVAPYDIAYSMAAALDATYSSVDGIFILDCPADNDDKVFYFNFGDVKIKVPLMNFILESEDGKDYCGFGVLPSEDTWILGDSFLKSAYIVYDLDNYSISLAQTKFNSTSDLEVIKNGTIPKSKVSKLAPWDINGTNNNDTTSIFTDSLPISCKTPQKRDLKTIPNHFALPQEFNNIIVEYENLASRLSISNILRFLTTLLFLLL